jgi:hypothetical protein
MTSRHYYAFTTNSRQISIFFIMHYARNKEKKNQYKIAWSTRERREKEQKLCIVAQLRRGLARGAQRRLKSSASSVDGARRGPVGARRRPVTLGL